MNCAGACPLHVWTPYFMLPPTSIAFFVCYFMPRAGRLILVYPQFDRSLSSGSRMIDPRSPGSGRQRQSLRLGYMLVVISKLLGLVIDTFNVTVVSASCSSRLSSQCSSAHPPGTCILLATDGDIIEEEHVACVNVEGVAPVTAAVYPFACQWVSPPTDSLSDPCVAAYT